RPGPARIVDLFNYLAAFCRIEWIRDNYPLLITAGTGGTILLFLISWSYELSLTLLFLLGVGVFCWISIEGSFILATVLAVLLAVGGMTYIGWRFPEQEQAR